MYLRVQQSTTVGVCAVFSTVKYKMEFVYAHIYVYEGRQYINAGLYIKLLRLIRGVYRYTSLYSLNRIHRVRVVQKSRQINLIIRS